jgi:WD40 repeat protein
MICEFVSEIPGGMKRANRDSTSALCAQTISQAPVSSPTPRRVTDLTNHAPQTTTMSPMMEDSPLSPAEPEGFTLLQHGHRDMVEATAFNSYGDRFATSSIDGKIKVYNRHKDGSWNICDTWGAHTAEILQVYLHSAPSCIPIEG